MNINQIYRPRSFNFSGLEGIWDRTLGSILNCTRLWNIDWARVQRRLLDRRCVPSRITDPGMFALTLRRKNGEEHEYACRYVSRRFGGI
jgi:hypothetical protein